MAELTRNALSRALIELLEKKPLDRITIAEITSLAGVNRQTFYYHFTDIYDIVRWTVTEAYSDILGKRGITGILFDEAPLNAFLDLVFDNRTISLNIFRGIDEGVLRRALHEAVDPEIESEVIRIADGRLSMSDIRFAVAYYTSSYYGVFIEWLDTGLDEFYRNRMRNLMYTLKDTLVLLVEKLVDDRIKNA